MIIYNKNISNNNNQSVFRSLPSTNIENHKYQSITHQKTLSKFNKEFLQNLGYKIRNK